MRNILILFLIIIVIGVGLYLMPTQKTQTTSSTGEALIGGDFLLINQYGEETKNSDFQGKLMLVFFGFTHCPSICPTGLFTMSKAMNLLGKDSQNIVPIFITLDPERDTVDVMKDYLSNFHKSFIGLTGTVAQTKSVADLYRIYYAKVVDTNSAMEYSMDHSTFSYLMDRNGKYITHFNHNITAEEMAYIIKEYL